MKLHRDLIVTAVIVGLSVIVLVLIWLNGLYNDIGTVFIHLRNFGIPLALLGVVFAKLQEKDTDALNAKVRSVLLYISIGTLAASVVSLFIALSIS